MPPNPRSEVKAMRIVRLLLDVAVMRQCDSASGPIATKASVLRRDMDPSCRCWRAGLSYGVGRHMRPAPPPPQALEGQQGFMSSQDWPTRRHIGLAQRIPPIPPACMQTSPAQHGLPPAPAAQLPPFIEHMPTCAQVGPATPLMQLEPGQQLFVAISHRPFGATHTDPLSATLGTSLTLGTSCPLGTSVLLITSAPLGTSLPIVGMSVALGTSTLALSRTVASAPLPESSSCTGAPQAAAPSERERAKTVVKYILFMLVKLTERAPKGEVLRFASGQRKTLF